MRSTMQRLAGAVLLVEGWRRALLAFAAGALATFALAPYDLVLLPFLSFPLLVWLLDGAAGDPQRGAFGRAMPAFATGWFFGFGYFVGGLWWLAAALLVDEGGAFLWAIPFAVFGLPALLAIFFGLAAVLARLLWSDGPWRILALAFALSLAEYGRARLFTGFPWNEIGMAAAPVPLLMQSAAIVGVHGLTLGALLVFSAPAVLVDRQGRGSVLALAGLVLLAHLGFGAARLFGAVEGNAPDVALRVVQPNIRQSLKWDADEAERNFARLLDLTRAADAPAAAPAAGEAATLPSRVPVADAAPVRRLVVWPETAFPFLLTERPDAVARLAETLAPGETLIAGAVRLEMVPNGEPIAYNSVYVIDEAGEILDARDKLHLVPFGEYLPFEDLLDSLGISRLAEGPGRFAPGATRAPVPLAGAPAFVALICYEIIFPGEIATLGPDGTRAGFVLNVTNDAWYGATPGPYQHLRASQLTAVALGLPLVRAANTGVSVVADPYGRVRDGLALGASGTIDAPLPLPAPPTLYERVRDAPFLAGLALALLGALAGRAGEWRRRRLDRNGAVRP